MPRDVHRSLELLEQYHSELFRPSDVELKQSVEKVISIFKTNLFNALCDINDFYESVLLNDRISTTEKAFASRRFADRWQLRSVPAPFPGGGFGGSAGAAPLSTTTTTKRYYASDTESRHTVVSRPDSALGASGGGMAAVSPGATAASALLETMPMNRVIDEFGREWEVEETLLNASQTGLGFSISGGQDRDPEPDGTRHIRVTDIATGGAVARDGRIRVGDVILKVNGNDCVHVDHQTAVDYLERAGPYVRLLVKRLKPQRSLSQSYLPPGAVVGGDPPLPTSLKGSRSLHQLPQSPLTSQLDTYSTGATRAPRFVTLRKGSQGLGFNIVGGEDGEPIYVSHVLPGGPAYISGDVRKGDVLLRVGDVELQGANHGQAAMTLKSIPPNTYVRLLLHYRPREYHAFEDKVERLRQDLLRQQELNSSFALDMEMQDTAPS